MVNEIISTIFRIYLSQLKIYQRFLKYIDDSTRNIDLPTKNDIIKRGGLYASSFYLLTPS
ncbi:hypothetical protein BHL25_07755 [Bacillus cereus]|nr:hypothetical protein BHL25_07755 [Bacillus cereus]